MDQARLDDYHRRLIELIVGRHNETQRTADAGNTANARGQRDSLIHAYGLSLAAQHRTQPETTVTDRVRDRIIALLDRGVTDHQALATVAALAAQGPTDRVGGLAWVGPLAFARNTAAQKGTDIDFGFTWGEHCDTRVSLRREIDATHGLLYAYNATWDEYAILAEDIAIDHVQVAYRRTIHAHPHLPLTELVTAILLTRPPQLQPRTTPAPDAPTPIKQVRR
ncbi:MAG TPA: hypothetical protein P5181_07200 [Dermatophilaceae bacterium]|nr:hypothetical protein [Dermatophilaceae bacterium]